MDKPTQNDASSRLTDQKLRKICKEALVEIIQKPGMPPKFKLDAIATLGSFLNTPEPAADDLHRGLCDLFRRAGFKVSDE